MTTTTHTAPATAAAFPAVVLPLAEGGPQAPELEAIDRALGGLVARLIQDGILRGQTDQQEMIHTLGKLPAERVLLVGSGRPADLDLKRLTDWAVRVARRLRKSGVSEAAVLLPEVGGATREQVARATVEGLELGAREFLKYKSAAEAARELKKVAFLARDGADEAALARGIRIGEAVAAGMTLTRELGNEPANVATPIYLAERARELARDHGLACTVLGPEEMATLGMGALLGVARGSDEPARFIVLEHPGSGGPTMALVGKGLTFDSGGISIKPAPKMHEMKFDMCGGAAVMGSLLTLARLGARQRVVGIIPASENLPSGKALKPGDVLRSLAGITIEVTNTDAEGRLILADAITYARRYQPAAVIDIATLTGAVVIALGSAAMGMMGNDEGFLEHVRQAGARTGERVWPLPLYREYLEAMRSEIADLVNSSSAGGKASTAAAFLSRFAEGLRWAHLDIAGTAWAEGEGGERLLQGATGSGVRTMVEATLSLEA